MAESQKQKNIFRKRLLSVIGNDRDLLAMADVKLMTSNKHTKNWLYSDLKGNLCFVLDHSKGARFLILFDSKSLLCLFNMELYKNFDKYYHDLSESFQCFEISGGSFIGFKFEDLQQAKSFSTVVRKFDDNFTTSLIEHSNFKKKENDKKQKFTKYCDIIKKKGTDIFPSLKNYDEQYMEEDGLDINIPKELNILKFIAYDNDKKVFHLEKTAPKFVKNMFKNSGLRKSDLKDTGLMLYFIKKIIEEYEKLALVQAIYDNKTQEQDQVFNARSLIRNILKTNSGPDKYVEPLRKIYTNIDPEMNIKHNNIAFRNTMQYEPIDLLKEVGNQKTIVEDSKIKTTTVPSVIPKVPSVPTKGGIPAVPAVPKVPGVPKIPTNLVSISPISLLTF